MMKMKYTKLSNTCNIVSGEYHIMRTCLHWSTHGCLLCWSSGGAASWWCFMWRYTPVLNRFSNVRCKSLNNDAVYAFIDPPYIDRLFLPAGKSQSCMFQINYFQNRIRWCRHELYFRNPTILNSNLSVS